MEFDLSLTFWSVSFIQAIIGAIYIGHIQQCFSSKRWADLLKLIDHTTKAALKKDAQSDEWGTLRRRLNVVQQQVKHAENALAFTFVEVSRFIYYSRRTN